MEKRKSFQDYLLEGGVKGRWFREEAYIKDVYQIRSIEGDVVTYYSIKKGIHEADLYDFLFNTIEAFPEEVKKIEQGKDLDKIVIEVRRRLWEGEHPCYHDNTCISDWAAL